MTTPWTVPWTLDRLREASEPEPNTGCWLWTRSVDQDGYGWASLDGRTIKAHRLAFWLKHGFFVPLVMHQCDMPGCVNADHLRAGTPLENQQDKARKGRSAHRIVSPVERGAISARVSGVKNPCAKANPEIVRAIRTEHAAGAKQNALAIKYGLHKMTVNRIVRRRGWTTA